MCSEQKIQNSTIHPFEQAGLGLAPFRFVGMAKNDPLTLCPPTNKCDYCGTHIVYNFIIESSDKKKFIVGSDCVERTGDITLNNFVNRELKAIRKAQAQAKKTEKFYKKHAATIEKINDGFITFVKYVGKTFEEVSKTDIQYLVWMHNNTLSNPIGDAIKMATEKYVAIVNEQKAEKERIREQKDSISRHVGKVGDKIVFSATIEVMYPVGGAYSGTSYLIVMRDDFGNLYSTYYSGKTEFEKNKEYKFSATIKDHAYYKGANQTRITRIKSV